jgi:hypothetical protein
MSAQTEGSNVFAQFRTAWNAKTGIERGLQALSEAFCEKLNTGKATDKDYDEWLAASESNELARDQILRNVAELLPAVRAAIKSLAPAEPGQKLPNT